MRATPPRRSDRWCSRSIAGHAPQLSPELFAAEDEISEELASVNPTPRLLRGTGIAHEKLGDVMVARGDLAAAIEEYRQEVALLGRASDAAPDDDSIKSDLSWTQMNLGDIEARAGRAEDAARDYRASLAVRQALAKRYPDDPQTRSDVSEIEAKLKALDR